MFHILPFSIIQTSSWGHLAVLVPQVAFGTNTRRVYEKRNPDAGANFTSASLGFTPNASRIHTKSMLCCRKITAQSKSLHSVRLCNMTVSGDAWKFRETWQVWILHHSCLKLHHSCVILHHSCRPAPTSTERFN